MEQEEEARLPEPEKVLGFLSALFIVPGALLGLLAAAMALSKPQDQG